jgi:hypothetical protein
LGSPIWYGFIRRQTEQTSTSSPKVLRSVARLNRPFGDRENARLPTVIPVELVRLEVDDADVFQRAERLVEGVFQQDDEIIPCQPAPPPKDLGSHTLGPPHFLDAPFTVPRLITDKDDAAVATPIQSAARAHTLGEGVTVSAHSSTSVFDGSKRSMCSAHMTNPPRSPAAGARQVVSCKSG